MQDLLNAFPKDADNIFVKRLASSCDFTPSLQRMRTAIDTMLEVRWLRKHKPT